MNFHLSDTFTAAYDKLTGQEQKAVKASVFDLQLDPSGRALRMHRIDNSNDPNFWSMRVNKDVRLIVHKTGESLLVAYVDHHDKAYAWAERRRIEAHPKTGAIQIVEVRERVEEIARPEQFDFLYQSHDVEPKKKIPALPHHFSNLNNDDLLEVGVPTDWLSDVRASNEDEFLAIFEHLPAEAAEALLEYATTGKFPEKIVVVESDPFAHPDTQRRIRLITDSEELEQALAFPWEKWGVFLHPSQKALVEREFSGPARAAGSAGTGKTVVAIHRAVRLAKANAGARVLLASFSNPLAAAMARKVLVLAPENGGVVPRITTLSFHGVAEQLYQLEHGVRPRIASEASIKERLLAAAKAHSLLGFSERFLFSEWMNVIDAWGIGSGEEYATVKRMGRKSRLGPKQREKLWPVFDEVRSKLSAERFLTWADVFTNLAKSFSGKVSKPFDHIILDEAQDLAPAELRFFAAIARTHSDALFLAGDIGQRIFQHPFSWTELGVNVRGRSHSLRVCYRTSQQIRSTVDGLLPSKLRDIDGFEDERRGVVSVFNGPEPEIQRFGSIEDERLAVKSHVEDWMKSEIGPHEIGIFVRSPNLVTRARDAVATLPGEADITIGTMNLAKGLEFRAVVVMACDEGVLPLDERVSDAADEAELDEIYETERRLLYVACTRARDQLLVTAVEPGSEYLTDFLRPSSK